MSESSLAQILLIINKKTYDEEFTLLQLAEESKVSYRTVRSHNDEASLPIRKKSNGKYRRRGGQKDSYVEKSYAAYLGLTNDMEENFQELIALRENQHFEMFRLMFEARMLSIEAVISNLVLLKTRVYSTPPMPSLKDQLYKEIYVSEWPIMKEGEKGLKDDPTMVKELKKIIHKLDRE